MPYQLIADFLPITKSGKFVKPTTMYGAITIREAEAIYIMLKNNKSILSVEQFEKFELPKEQQQAVLGGQGVVKQTSSGTSVKLGAPVSAGKVK